MGVVTVGVVGAMATALRGHAKAETCPCKAMGMAPQCDTNSKLYDCPVEHFVAAFRDGEYLRVFSQRMNSGPVEAIIP